MKGLKYSPLLPLLIIIKVILVPASDSKTHKVQNIERYHPHQYVNDLYRKQINRWTDFDDFPVPEAHPARQYESRRKYLDKYRPQYGRNDGDYVGEEKNQWDGIDGELNNGLRSTDNNATAINVRPYNLSVNWVEEADEYGRAIDMDIYFDRAVILGLEGGGEPAIIAPGVLIDSMHILTSYNPFKNLNPAKGVAAILTKRRYDSTGSNFLKNIEYYAYSCARQVIQIPDQSLTQEQWHGMDHRHSPVHDLMVIEIVFNLTLLDPNPYIYSYHWASSSYWMNVGPVITDIANRTDELLPEMKFASLAFRDAAHISAHNRLSSKTYNIEDSPLLDCEEWMPRDWGHFICIRNVDDFPGVGSGALLIHKNKLYGIGSFALWKRNSSILVFTDVRPYHSTIFSTCRTGGRPIFDNTEEGQQKKMDNEENKERGKQNQFEEIKGEGKVAGYQEENSKEKRKEHGKEHDHYTNASKSQNEEDERYHKAMDFRYKDERRLPG